MRPDGRSMRECILAAAVQLFAEYGYHAAPLRDIARIAGIQAGVSIITIRISRRCWLRLWRPTCNV